MSRIALLLLCHPPSTQVRDSEAGRGKCFVRGMDFASSEFPDAEKVNATFGGEINSDDAAARVAALDSTPGADRWQGGTGGKTERTHMALLQLEKVTGLAGWPLGFWVCLQNRPPCGLSPFPLGAASHLHLPPIPIPRRRADSPLHTIFPRVIAVASSLRFL